jgi:hypothetical protein
MTDAKSPTSQVDATELEAARLERQIHAQERKAIEKHFPHVHNDVVFMDALLGELHRIQGTSEGITIADAAAQLKQSVKTNPELSALKPAYDKLLGEIGKYNRNPLDNRWIRDTSCWEKFVTAERAKSGIALAS